MPAVVGLGCGIAFLVLFSSLSYRVPALFDLDTFECGQNELMHLYFYESLDPRQSMTSPYEVSVATWYSIPIGDDTLSRIPLFKEAFAEVSSKPTIGGTDVRRIVTVNELKSIVKELPNQERFILDYEPDVHDGETGTIRHGNRLYVNILYNEVFYGIQAFCFLN